MAKRHNPNNKALREAIWKKFGWSMRQWAVRRGFSQYAIYDFLREKAGPNTSLQILKTLKTDGLLEYLKSSRNFVLQDEFNKKKASKTRKNRGLKNV